METIRNYLESMFRNLPETEKVLRAKSELLQMMEDKYTELIKEGKTENEAVGAVISNFGNLEELAKDLGIEDVFQSTRVSAEKRRKVTFDEVTKYLAAVKKSSLLTGLGIALCILSVCGPIITDAIGLHENLGAVIMFLSIGFGVFCFIMSAMNISEFDFLKNEACSIDNVTKDNVKNLRREYMSSYSVRLSIGVLLCVLCILPPMAFENFGLLEDLSAVFFFVFIAAGVFMIVTSNYMKNAYERIVRLNDKENFDLKRKRRGEYQNKTMKKIMSVYWPSVTCIYLCVSFLTYRWDLTWLIWPIAGVGTAILAVIFGETKDENL